MDPEGIPMRDELKIMQSAFLRSGLAGLALAAALAVAVAPALHAQSEGPATPNQRHASSWLEAYEILGGILTPEQQMELNQIAYQAAAANVCEFLILDDERFIMAFESLARQASAEMSAEEVDYFHDHLLVSFGVFVGLQLADHNNDTGAFCTEATTYAEDPEEPHLFEAAEQ